MKESDVHRELINSFKQHNIYAAKIPDMPFGGTGGGFNPKKPFDIFAFIFGGCGIEVKLLKEPKSFNYHQLRDNQIKALIDVTKSKHGAGFLAVNVRLPRNVFGQQVENNLFFFAWRWWGDFILHHQGIPSDVFISHVTGQWSKYWPKHGFVRCEGRNRLFDLSKFVEMTYW